MKHTLKMDGDKVVHLLLLAVVALLLYKSFALPATASQLPILVSVITLVLLLLSLTSQIFKGKAGKDSGGPFNIAKFIPIFALTVGYVGFTYLFGVLISSFVFIFLILTFLQKEKIVYNLVLTTCFNIGVYIVFFRFLNVPLFKGLIKIFNI